MISFFGSLAGWNRNGVMRKGINVGLLMGMLLLVFSAGCIKDHEAFRLTPEAEKPSALLRDDCREIVIEEGLVYEDAVVYECSGQSPFSSGDAALDGEEIGRMVLDALEGRDVEWCREAFEGENFFREFRNQGWEQLEAGWTANGYYDCYYSYVTKPQGYVGYTFYIYPDFDRMGVEMAGAVTFRCLVNAGSRKLCDTKLTLQDISRTEYESLREGKWDRTTFVKDGEIVEGGGWIIIPEQNTGERNQSLYTYEDMGSEQLVDLLRSDLGDGDLENGRTSRHLTEKDGAELSDMNGEVREMIEAGWTLSDKYDFYYIYQNERAGTVRYRYYFYWENPEAEHEKVLVTDAWITQNRIEELEHHWFLTDRHNRREALPEQDIRQDRFEWAVVKPLLGVDWTDSEILMQEHTIMPQDSAQGWEFAIADVDFDGMPEMLITFTSNHCGGNSLYIYKQGDGTVFSYADTIATPERYMLVGIDYKKISPYLDIELMDAYVNANQEYRYLSLDCSSFGGDIHGGMDTVILYETALGTDKAPKELARIEYCGPDQRKEMYFQGKRVYEAGRLRDLLADYMDGYAEAEIHYCVAEKAFARDIVGRSEEEREKENRELERAVKEAGVFMTEEEFDKIMQCLDQQVPEIFGEWADYVEEKSGGEAHMMAMIRGGHFPDAVYRDYQETEYLGEYYLVYVGESYEDHTANWDWFYVSEDFDEVLWYDVVMGEDSEYPVLYLDEWRRSERYRKLEW